MWSFPTLEPVVLENGSFVIDRMLPQSGEVLVAVGDDLSSDQIVAQSAAIEQTLTMFIASELDVENKSISKYVTKSVGSEVRNGEIIARVRRGLRTASVKAPTSGTVVSIDESNGTVVLATSKGKRELSSLVNGKVEQVVPGRGVVVRTSGTRLYGIVGFGSEAIGPLVAGTDRPDRELTSDYVSSEWKGSVVLAGMTAGVPTLGRLREIGAAAVIMGSIPEGDLRRFLTDGQMDRVDFWSPMTRIHGDFSNPSVETPLAIVVTEGFGRRPMNDVIFEVLHRHKGETVSLSAAVKIGDSLARPEIYLSGESGEDQTQDDFIRNGRVVRLVDSGIGAVPGVAVSDQYTGANRYGLQRKLADVRLSDATVRSAPISNIEVVQ